MGFIADTPLWKKPSPDEQLDLLTKRLADDMDFFAILVHHRGGCSCHISPPCSACCSPLTMEEAQELGWIE